MFVNTKFRLILVFVNIFLQFYDFKKGGRNPVALFALYVWLNYSAGV